MSKHDVVLSEVSEKSLKILAIKLQDKLDGNQLLDSCIAFSLFMIMCAEEDGLFEENLNNIMGTKDYKRFFTGEDG